MAAVLFAGLMNTFSTMRSVAEPADNIWLERGALTAAIIDQLGFVLDSSDIEQVENEWQRVNRIPLAKAGRFHSREASRTLVDEAKLYWATETEGFSEQRTSTDTLMLDGKVQVLSLPIATVEQRVTALRFDVANRPGCFEIQEMCVVDAGGDAIWRWQYSRDELSGIQNADVVIDPEQGRACVLSRGNDPQFKLDLPSAVMHMVAGNVFQIKLSAWPQRV